MKYLPMLSVLGVGIVLSVAMAQTLALDGGCTFSWDANPATENVTSYNLYLQKDGLQMPTVSIPASATTITCKAAGVQANGSWSANVTAVNAVGESGPSNAVTFTQRLAVKPGAPKNFGVK